MTNPDEIADQIRTRLVALEGQAKGSQASRAAIRLAAEKRLAIVEHQRANSHPEDPHYAPLLAERAKLHRLLAAA